MPESYRGGWFPKLGIFRSSVRPISGETCPNCTWPLPTFRKFVQTLGTLAYAFQKATIIAIRAQDLPGHNHEIYNLTHSPRVNTCSFEIWPDV